MADNNNNKDTKKDPKNKKNTKKVEDDDDTEVISLVPNSKSDEFKFDFNFNFDANNPFPTGGFENSSTLLNFVKSKFNNKMGKAASADYVESLPKSVQRRVTFLKELNTESKKIDEKFEAEVRALELKYHELYKPIWAKRAKIISGEEEVKDEDLKSSEKAGEKEDNNNEENTNKEPADKKESDEKEEEEEEEPTKGIPDFWLTVLKNSQIFEECVTEEDEDLLKNLVNITYDPLGSEVGSFTLSFHFKENEYFTNDILIKTYHIKMEDSKPICDRVESTEINWKPGKNITKKKKGKLGDEGGSFFHFFYPPNLPDKNPPIEMIEELELDFDLAATLKDYIIHSAVLWFTGEAVTDGLSDDDDDAIPGFRFEDPNYNEDEDDDWEPEDDDDDIPSKEQPADCNQQ